MVDIVTKSEFIITHQWTSDLRSPLRWIISHLKRNPLFIVGMFLGAAGNAGLATIIPIFTGIAFDAMRGQTPNLRVLLLYAVYITLSQLVRAGLQLSRNF